MQDLSSIIQSSPASNWLLIVGSLSTAVISTSLAWLYQRRMKRQYKQLIQSSEIMEFALQSARMGTWDINLATDSVNCSKEMLDLWEMTQEEFNGDRSLLQAKVHPDDIERMKISIDEAIGNNGIYDFEYRIIPRPGVEKWVHSRGRCHPDPKSKKPFRFSGLVYDITEKKTKEKALSRAIKSRDQFFMIASHELRTPLTCLHLQMQVTQWDLRTKFPETLNEERIDLGLKKQNQHLKRISRIVDHILDETKIAEGRLQMQIEPFDLSEMVLDVIEQFKVTAESYDVEVSLIHHEQVFGCWDKFRLEQVLLNLLMNAIRYGNKKPIQVEVHKKEDAILIVRDFGVGISQEDQLRIFERFERGNGHNEVNGLGLGLFISKNIVQSHRGEIHLKSEPNNGSEFTVTLPCNLTQDQVASSR